MKIVAYNTRIDQWATGILSYQKNRVAMLEIIFHLISLYTSSVPQCHSHLQVFSTQNFM